MKFRLSSLALAAGLLATSLVSASATAPTIPSEWISSGNFEEIEALLKECPGALVKPLIFSADWDSTMLRTVCPYGLKPIQVAAANAQTNNRTDIVQFLIDHGATLTAEEKTLLLMKIQASLDAMTDNIRHMQGQLDTCPGMEAEITVVQDRVTNLAAVRQLIANRLPIERVSRSAWA